MNNDLVFSTVDPKNRNIVLKSDTWNNHIKNRHDECDIWDIKSNIENPRFIIQNIKPKEDGSSELVIDDSRQDYIDLISKNDKIYLIKTIVQFVNENEGFVVTNHILRKSTEIKTIGGVIYDRNKSENTTRFTPV